MKSLKRVAIVFDNTRRPETTGVYCRRALAELVGVEHLLPTQVERIRPGEFDAVIAIDDGLSDPLPTTVRPLAYRCGYTPPNRR